MDGADSFKLVGPGSFRGGARRSVSGPTTTINFDVKRKTITDSIRKYETQSSILSSPSKTSSSSGFSFSSPSTLLTTTSTPKQQKYSCSISPSLVEKKKKELEDEEKKRKRDSPKKNDSDFEADTAKKPSYKRIRKDTTDSPKPTINKKKENIDTSNFNDTAKPATKSTTKSSNAKGNTKSAPKGWGGKRNNFVRMNLKSKRGRFGKAGTWRFTRDRKGYNKEDGYDEEGNELKNRNWNVDYGSVEIVDDEQSNKVNNPNRDNDVDYSSVDLHKVLKDNFGTKCPGFQSGQVEAIQSVLAGNDTLAILPTGGGKSLIYQMCSLVFGGLTLVVSPLIALINDQMKNLPQSLPCATLSSTGTQGPSLSNTISLIRAGRVRILFVSPERVMSKTFIELVNSGKFPKIHFACIDEAHCVTEWSHNFRPSFLGVAGVLREIVGVKRLLALTATATKETEKAICKSLAISRTVRFGSAVKPSVHLSCSLVDFSKENTKLRELSLLVKSMNGPIVIYCSTRGETERVASHLEVDGHEAMAYHAKKSESDRLRIQEMFFVNKIRILVATIAYGMGVDKPDIRNIIHYTIPNSIEHYVQEVGRAGRDRKEAFTHVFLSDEDYARLHSFAHSDGVDQSQISSILKMIFSDKKRKGQEQKFVVLPKSKTIQDINVKEEVLATVLTTDPIEMKAKHVIIKLLMENNIGAARSQGQTICDLGAVVTKTGIPHKQIIDFLNKLQEEKEIKYSLDLPAWHLEATSELDTYEIEKLANSVADKMQMLEQERALKVEQMWNLFKKVAAPSIQTALPSHSSFSSRDKQLHQLVDKYFNPNNDSATDIHIISHSSSSSSISKTQYESASDEEEEEEEENKEEEDNEDSDDDDCVTFKIQNESMNESMEDAENESESEVENLPAAKPTVTVNIDESLCKNWMFVKGDIVSFLRRKARKEGWSGRNVARIFHAMPSAKFPYEEWNRDPSWGCHKTYPFAKLMQLAEDTIKLMANIPTAPRDSDDE